MKTKIEKLRDWLAGEADENTAQQLRDEVARPDSPLGRFLDVLGASLRELPRSAVARLLEHERIAVASTPAGQPPPQARRSWLPWAAGVLFGLLLVSSVYGAVSFFHDRAGLRRFWTDFARTDDQMLRAAIVLPDPPLHLPAPGGKPISSYVGTGDALALARAIEVLVDCGATRDQIRVLSSAQPQARKVTTAELVLGGPNSSARSLELMAHLLNVNPNDRDSLKEGFRFVVRPEGPRNAFSEPARDSQDPLGIRDIESGEICEVQLANVGDRVDAALVMRGKVDGREVIVVSGYEDTGTLMGLRAIAEPGPILNEFNRTFRESGYAAMVLVTKPGSSDPVLFKFQHAKNPRGK